MCSNVYDVVLDFEVCGFTKNMKIKISWEWNIIFSSNKKIHSILRVIKWQKNVLEQR